MTDQNPYQAPPDIDPLVSPPAAEIETIGMEFESDWSIEGLRARRRSDGQRLGDLAFAILTIAWLASILAAFSGLFCLLTIAWISGAFVWFSNVTYRKGGNFTQRYAGLAGPVTGRIDGGWVRIDGPALRIAARVRDCPQCSLNHARAFIQPPGIDTSLPIASTDVTKTWRSPNRVFQKSAIPVDLLGELSGDREQVIASGTVRGTDLRGQNCWRVWCGIGWTCTTIGGACLILAIYRFANLPPWVLDRPSHYRWSDADVQSLTTPIFLVVAALVLLLVGVWHVLKTFRFLGDFAALITPTMIAIANHRIAFGYHGSALAHFHWTDRGMVVRSPMKYVQFLIPARWFNQHERELVSLWHPAKPETPKSSSYIGPTV